MNQSKRCHEIAGCRNIYVDAFNACKDETANPDATFILSHYHADHYGGLPKHGKYNGPAKIHCTPVTARLLVEIHGVSSDLVVAHDYGVVWQHTNNYNNDDSSSVGAAVVDICFYDANHCPGAAITVFRLPDVFVCQGKCVVHVHTGDMRYHEKMQHYPMLRRDSSGASCIDIVYLDTTYGHPKHKFMPQEDAVRNIGMEVEKLLCSGSGSSKINHEENDISTTLVLLSCYSIGKEKVLLEAAMRSRQKIFVTERKHRMLQCVGSGLNELSLIINHITTEASESDLHVVPMGLAGNTHPFFQPNFEKIYLYATKLKSDHGKEYNKIAAFIPTGWADASNWNKKNARSQQFVHGINIEVRLVAYSEHSSFQELCAFLKILKPRKILPTVFSSEKDYVAIERYFHSFCDRNRAMKAFFGSTERIRKEQSSSKNLTIVKSKKRRKVEFDVADIESSVGIIVIDDDSSKDDASPSEASQYNTKSAVSEEVSGIEALVSMGFNRDKARKCLRKCNGNVEQTVEHLVRSVNEPTAIEKREHYDIDDSSSPATAPAIKNHLGLKKVSKRNITSYFARNG